MTWISSKWSKMLLKYTAVYGCIRSGDVVGEYISSNHFVRGALGPNVWGNLFNVFFFVNNTVGELVMDYRTIVLVLAGRTETYRC